MTSGKSAKPARPAPRARRLLSGRRESAQALLLFAPFFILFFIFTVLPVLSAFALSLTTYSVVRPPVFVGIDNYRYMLSEDTVYLKAMTNTFIFAFFSGIIGYLMSFTIAWVIDSLKGRMAFALAFYAPSITSGIAMSIVWLYFFSPDSYGFINNALLQIGLLEKPMLWTKDPSLITFVVVFVSVWMGMGNGFLGFLAGFQNLSPEISEAGRIDGVSNKLQELIFIILPQMKPMLLFGAITAVANAFNIYDVPLTLAGSPGPENSSLTLVGHINDYAFTRLDLGYASTVAVFLFLTTFAIGQGLFRLLGSKSE